MQYLRITVFNHSTQYTTLTECSLCRTINDWTDDQMIDKYIVKETGKTMLLMMKEESKCFHWCAFSMFTNYLFSGLVEKERLVGLEQQCILMYLKCWLLSTTCILFIVAIFADAGSKITYKNRSVFLSFYSFWRRLH